MIRSQRLLLKPTFKQRHLFAGSAGLSRRAWNWAVSFCKHHYGMFGKRKGYKRIGAYKLAERWNKAKNRGTKLAWVKQYSKLIPEASFRAFDRAMKATFARLKKGKAGGFPRFHKKGRNDSFQVVPSKHFPLSINANHINIPRIGFVRIQTPLRWPEGKQIYGQVKFKAGRWWLTLSYDLPDPPKLSENRPVCGVDLGTKVFAAIVSGEVIETVPPLKPYAKAKQRMKRLGRSLSRKFVKGKRQSNRYIRAKLKLAKAHERIANLRSNYTHQLTAKLTKAYGTIVLEDLNVKAMGEGWHSGTIQDVGMAEFRRQVAYKAEVTGTRVVFADRYFPSSKMCCECGRVNGDLTLKERAIWCPCGNMMDRDENAARNLEKLGRGTPEGKHAESGSSSPRKGRGAARRSVNANTTPERVK